MENQIYVEKQSDYVIYNDLHCKPRLTEDIRPEEAKGFLKNSSSDNMGESIISTSSVICTDTNYNDNIKQFQYQISKIQDGPSMERLQKPPLSRNNMKRDSRTINVDDLKNIDLIRANMQHRDIKKTRLDIYGSHMDSEESFEASSDEDEEIKKPSINVEPPKVTVNKPEPERLLGEGAFGKVHHVVRKSDGEQFALKVLSKKNITKKLQNEIQRERELLMNVNHPNIIKLHQCFHDPKNLYFVMDCAENGELFHYMKNEGTLELKEAQFLTAEMISIVEYLQK